MSPIHQWALIARHMRRHFIALDGVHAFSYVRPDLLCERAANDSGPRAA